MAVEINHRLIKKVNEEIARGIEKWGCVDKSPDVLLNAALEELGEVAHAVNHNEGIESVRQEIAEAIGVLARLYDMVEIYIRPKPVLATPELIITAVLDDFKINHAQLKGRSRKQEVTLGRQIAMYLMRQHTDRSLDKVGQELGDRCPATVSHGYTKIAQGMMSDVELRHRVMRIEYSLRRRREG